MLWSRCADLVKCCKANTTPSGRGSKEAGLGTLQRGDIWPVKKACVIPQESHMLQLQRRTVFCWRMRVTAWGTKRVRSEANNVPWCSQGFFRGSNSAQASRKKPLLLVRVKQRSRRLSTVYLCETGEERKSYNLEAHRQLGWMVL